MTPDKRKTLVFVFVVALTFVGIAAGWLTSDVWLPVVLS